MSGNQIIMGDKTLSTTTHTMPCMHNWKDIPGIVSCLGFSMGVSFGAYAADNTAIGHPTHAASGVIVLKESKMSGDQPIVDDKTLFISIKAQLEKVDTEIAAQNWEAASRLIRQALAELGDRYTRSDTIDDSDMKLIAADIQEKEGRLDNAANVRRRILAGRLEMLRSKIE
ncbi:MAG: hypothetical protein LBV29_06345 [Azoarcus sp.]|nr:hypothetical protein [Azoarcus sp.]